MSTRRIAGVAVLAALALGPLSPSTASAAPADRLHLHQAMTVGSDGGRSVFLACQQKLGHGRGFRVYFQVDNTRGSERVRGSLSVQRGRQQIESRSTGRVAPGATSAVRHLLVPAGPRITVETTLESAHGGGGGGGPLSFRRC